MRKTDCTSTGNQSKNSSKGFFAVVIKSSPNVWTGLCWIFAAAAGKQAKAKKQGINPKNSAQKPIQKTLAVE